MKMHKKLILLAATVLVVGGAGTGVAFALQPEEPKQAEVEQVATVQSAQTEVPEPVETPSVVVEPVVEEEPPVAPLETLQEEIKRRVEEVALARGLGDATKWGDNMVSAQSLCMDRIIGRNIGGYDDETRVREYASSYLTERINSEGKTTYTYFDGAGTCRVMSYTLAN